MSKMPRLHKAFSYYEGQDSQFQRHVNLSKSDVKKGIKERTLSEAIMAFFKKKKPELFTE